MSAVTNSCRFVWLTSLDCGSFRVSFPCMCETKTSNESSNELQTLPVGCSGKALFEEIACLCQRFESSLLTISCIRGGFQCFSAVPFGKPGELFFSFPLGKSGEFSPFGKSSGFYLFVKSGEFSLFGK